MSAGIILPCHYLTGEHQTRNRTQPSYSNKTSFLNKIDALPTQGPKWTCDIVTAAGDRLDDNGRVMVENLELWRRDPVECVKELMGNPAFRDVMAYAPERHYEDESRNIRIYDEMWTGNWWWDSQVSNQDTE